MKNFKDETPLDLAYKMGYEECYQNLVKLQKFFIYERAIKKRNKYEEMQNNKKSLNITKSSENSQQNNEQKNRIETIQSSEIQKTENNENQIPQRNYKSEPNAQINLSIRSIQNPNNNSFFNQSIFLQQPKGFFGKISSFLYHGFIFMKDKTASGINFTKEKIKVAFENCRRKNAKKKRKNTGIQTENNDNISNHAKTCIEHKSKKLIRNPIENQEIHEEIQPKLRKKKIKKPDTQPDSKHKRKSQKTPDFNKPHKKIDWREKLKERDSESPKNPIKTEEKKTTFYDMIMKSVENIEENLKICKSYNLDKLMLQNTEKEAEIPQKLNSNRTNKNEQVSLGSIINCIDDTNVFEGNPQYTLSDQECSFAKSAKSDISTKNRNKQAPKIGKDYILEEDFVCEDIEGEEKKSPIEKCEKVSKKECLTDKEDCEDSNNFNITFNSASDIPGEIKGRIRHKKYE